DLGRNANPHAAPPLAAASAPQPAVFGGKSLTRTTAGRFTSQTPTPRPRRGVLAAAGTMRPGAAAGAAVETIPPPIPQSAMGSVKALTLTARPFAAASTTCTDTVFGDGGSASAALRRTSSPDAVV